MVPVGEGMGDTKGEGRGAVSTLRGATGLTKEWAEPRSSRREVNASLICVEGNRMMHLKRASAFGMERCLGEHNDGTMHAGETICKHTMPMSVLLSALTHSKNPTIRNCSCAH